jgi:hypothetical protein
VDKSDRAYLRSTETLGEDTESRNARLKLNALVEKRVSKRRGCNVTLLHFKYTVTDILLDYAE